MKIQLDTENKTIKVEEAVSLGELTETLKRLLPNGEWKSFKLETHTQINWTPNPIVIKEYPRYRTYPWWGIQTGATEHHTYSGSPSVNINTNDYTMLNGVYNIEAA